MIPEDRIGNTKTKIAVNYRKKQKGQETDGTTPTEKQIQELLILGISLELPKTSVDIFIEKIEVLQSLGVDTSKIVQRDTIKSLGEKSEISEEQLKNAGLNPSDAIGSIKNSIAKNYRNSNLGKKTNGKPPTDIQIQKLLELGINLEIQQKKKIKDIVKENKDNLSEAVQVGEELETEILMAEKSVERSASDVREQ